MTMSRSAGWWTGLVLVCAVSAPIGWLATDRLEAQNDFCNACHLPSGEALHREIRDDFVALPAPTLAGAHAVAGNVMRADGMFRCIDCHGGASFLGKVRVKALAARDAAVWITGQFDEPVGMRWPLWDEDCRQCHLEFRPAEREAWQSAAFHELAVHNVELGVECVECHTAHERIDPEAPYFLDVVRVRSQCARCHPEFEEANG
jgi:nitrate/TMAO reductase-like tetraheme cytochrome c subunit